MFSKSLQPLLASVRRLLEVLNTIEMNDDDVPMTTVSEKKITKESTVNDAAGSKLNSDNSDTVQGTEYVIVDAEMSKKRKPDASASGSESQKAPKRSGSTTAEWKADLKRLKIELSSFFWRAIVFTQDTVVARNIASATAKNIGKVTLAKRNQVKKQSRLTGGIYVMINIIKSVC